jgi:hypothetical protein
LPLVARYLQYASLDLRRAVPRRRGTSRAFLSGLGEREFFSNLPRKATWVGGHGDGFSWVSPRFIEGGTGGMRTWLASLGIALLVAVAVTGCGPDLKKENDQLKAQVETLQRENLALKGEATSLKADAEAMRKRFEAMNQEKQALETQLKDAEAKIAVKPGTKPPLKPKKTS